MQSDRSTNSNGNLAPLINKKLSSTLKKDLSNLEKVAKSALITRDRLTKSPINQTKR